MIRQRLWLPVFSLFVLLSGCGLYSIPEQASGPSVALVPVTHTLSLKGDLESVDQSQQQFERFISQLQTSLLTQPITLTWYNAQGQLLGARVYTRLLELGVSETQITKQDLSLNYDPLQKFDFTFTLVEHHTQVTPCEPNRIDNYYNAGNGCFIENARWQSMVRPENTLMSPDASAVQ